MYNVEIMVSDLQWRLKGTEPTMQKSIKRNYHSVLYRLLGKEQQPIKEIID